MFFFFRECCIHYQRYVQIQKCNWYNSCADKVIIFFIFKNLKLTSLVIDYLR